ncbi:MAG TPA: FlgD immunoglobulin-like domain containing protein [Candidatus Krumholzibacteria bacterium]|nr:FlgD immunoglobulin-like domain containing protein [Candidatus Krumholzibacteria bacterium]
MKRVFKMSCLGAWLLAATAAGAAPPQAVLVRSFDPAARVSRTYFVGSNATEADAIDFRLHLIDEGARNVNLILPERVIVCDLPRSALASVEMPAGFTRSSALEVESGPAVAGLSWIADAHRTVDRMAKEPASSSAGFSAAADGFKDVVITPTREQLEESERNLARGRTLPGGAPNALPAQLLQESSQFLGGSVCANFIYPESDGRFETNSEDWTDAELIQAKQGAYEALLGWQGKFPSMDLSFVMNSFERAGTGYEPIAHVMRTDPVWVLDALRSLGYSQTSDMMAEVHRFNQDKRALVHTQWVFTGFIANSRNTPNNKFGSGTADYTAYAFLGGPCLIEPFPAGTDINGVGERLVYSQIVNHEGGHCFWTLDEYPGAPGSCSSRSGYLNYTNGNLSSVAPNGVEMRCNLLQECIMHTAARKDLMRPWCNWSRGHLGVIDGNDNGKPDIFEAAPLVEFEQPGADTVTTNEYTLRFKAIAQAVPNRNPNIGPEKRISYAAPLREGYLGFESGSRADLTPLDGKWDEVEEECEFHVQLATAGASLFVVNVENSVGMKSKGSAKTVYFVGVDYSRTALTSEINRIKVTWEIVGNPFAAKFDVYRLGPGEAMPGTRIADDVAAAGPPRAGFIPYQYIDRDIVAGRDYRYYIQGDFSLPYDGGTRDYSSRSRVIEKTAMIPITDNVISNIAPNPSRGSVTMSIAIPRTYGGPERAPMRMATPVNVSIYSVNGQLVRTLTSAGSLDEIMTLRWDGTNERNVPAPSGVYFVKAQAGENKGFKKIVLLR